jgi:hypothetical protein
MPVGKRISANPKNFEIDMYWAEVLGHTSKAKLHISNMAWHIKPTFVIIVITATFNGKAANKGNKHCQTRNPINFSSAEASGHIWLQSTTCGIRVLSRKLKVKNK